MILIGIAGRSGAGKTSLSSMLADELECEVYHLDDLQLEVEKLKKHFLLRNLTVTEEETNKRYVNSKIKGKDLDDDTINKLYEKVKLLALKSIIKNKIAEQIFKGSNYFIIEGTKLGVYVSINNIDVRILVKRQYDLRKRDIILREGISTEEFDERENYDEQKMKFYRDFEYIIENK